MVCVCFDLLVVAAADPPPRAAAVDDPPPIGKMFFSLVCVCVNFILVYVNNYSFGLLAPPRHTDVDALQLFTTTTRRRLYCYCK